MTWCEGTYTEVELRSDILMEFVFAAHRGRERVSVEAFLYVAELNVRQGKRDSARDWGRMHKRRTRARVSEWKKANPEKRKANDAKHRERLRARIAADPALREKILARAREYDRKRSARTKAAK